MTLKFTWGFNIHIWFPPPSSIKLPSTAIKRALKVALYDLFDSPLAPLNGKFNEKVNHYNKKKERKNFDGTKRKISFGNH